MKPLLYFALPILAFSSPLTDSQNTIPFPGLGYTPPFKTYSGYLDAKNQSGNSNWRLFYWLTESKNDPAKDPLAIYLAGGPGCTSVGEAFQEMGPFYMNYGGESLYENIYAWNARANVLYIDSPIGTGFSYDTTNPDYSYADDDQSTQQNYNALLDFFTRVAPEYASRDFYFTGSSYSGVWQPMLADLVVQGINSKMFPNKNFKGFAIGNGYMDVNDLNNALVLWDAYHGKVSLRAIGQETDKKIGGISDWAIMKDECFVNGIGTKHDMDTYEFHRFIKTTDNLNWKSDGSKCGDMVMKLWNVSEVEAMTSPYNFYLQCWGYQDPDGVSSAAAKTTSHHKGATMGKYKTGFDRSGLYTKPNQDPNINTANMLNYDSSDNQFGRSCWVFGAVTNYFNKPEVQKIFHIANDWKAKNGNVKEYVECNNDLYNNYNHKYPSMQPYFDRILNNWKDPLKILIYNGDVDTVCNYLGDMKFVQRLAQQHNYTENERVRWNYRGLTAGWQQRYQKDQITIDMLTVKGSGHFVPNDKGGAAVQMITGFFAHNPPNYETLLVDPTPQPIQFPVSNNPTNSTSQSPTFSSNSTSTSTTTQPVTKSSFTLFSVYLIIFFVFSMWNL